MLRNTAVAHLPTVDVFAVPVQLYICDPNNAIQLLARFYLYSPRTYSGFRQSVHQYSRPTLAYVLIAR